MTISILAFLVLSAFLDRCGLPCLGSCTKGIDGSGLLGVDCLSSSLQVHDLFYTLVKLLQRFSLVLLEFVPEGRLRLHFQNRYH